MHYNVRDRERRGEDGKAGKNGNPAVLTRRRPGGVPVKTSRFLHFPILEAPLSPLSPLSPGGVPVGTVR